MKITKELLKFPQIDAAMKYIVENNFTYKYENLGKWTRKNLGIIEFGTGSGKSLQKICDYVENNDLDVYLMGYDSGEGLPCEEEGIPIFPKYIERTYKYDFSKTIRLFKSDKNVCLTQCLFDKIPKEHSEFINAAILIHIDSDLYISAKQALEWCFDNNLIIKHTLIAFDEYFSVRGGGEEKAFHEAILKYKFETKEIFHYIYYDKDIGQEIRQSVFEVTEI